jgi:hypothetical protein
MRSTSTAGGISIGERSFLTVLRFDIRTSLLMLLNNDEKIQQN